MGRNLLVVLVLAVFVSSVPAVASGFVCKGESYNAKLFNYREPKKGTRKPAALILSSHEEGTVLEAYGAEIRKENLISHVQYTVDGDGNQEFDTAILQIAFKEGVEKIAAGTSVEGHLILVLDGERFVYDLTCSRHKVGS